MSYLGSQCQGIVHHTSGKVGYSSLRQLITFMQSGSRGEMIVLAFIQSLSHLFFQSGTSDYGMMPPPLGTGLSTSINLIQNTPYRYAQISVPMMILKPTKLTTKLNHHTVFSQCTSISMPLSMSVSQPNLAYLRFPFQVIPVILSRAHPNDLTLTSINY